MHGAIAEILVLLATALALGMLAERLRQSAVLGYLAAGTLVGPNVLGWVEGGTRIDFLAELGAFLAGVLLGGSRFAGQIRADVAPLHTLLLTIFFTAIRLAGDPGWAYANAPLVLAVLGAVVIGKALLAAGGVLARAADRIAAITLVAVMASSPRTSSGGGSSTPMRSRS